MTPNEYQTLAMAAERTPTMLVAPDDASPANLTPINARLLHGAIGVCTEIGELQDAVKKHLIYNRELDLVNVGEEVGDILWYCALIADACGTTLETIMERNIAKLKLRFPSKFTFEAVNNRDLAAERKILEGSGQ